MSHGAHSDGGGHGAGGGAGHGPTHGHDAQAPVPMDPAAPSPAVPQSVTARITRRLKQASRAWVPLLCLSFVFWCCGVIGSYEGEAPYEGATRVEPSWWHGPECNTTIDHPEDFPKDPWPTCVCAGCKHPVEHNENFRYFWLFNEQPFAEEYFFRDEQKFLQAWQRTIAEGRNFHAGGRWTVRLDYAAGMAESACAGHDCGEHLTSYHRDLYLAPEVRRVANGETAPKGRGVFRMPGADGALVECRWTWQPKGPPRMPGEQTPAQARDASNTGSVFEPCHCAGGK